MWQRDIENISNILLENVTPNPNISQQDQQKLADFFVDLVVKIEQGDQEAIQLLQLSPDELLAQINNSEQEVQTEAFENIRAKVGGALSRGSALEKRYGILINNLNKYIWELEKDLQNTKTENLKPYQGMLSGLRRIDPDIKSSGGFLQKIGYGVGRGVGMAGKIAGVGLLASGLSSVGLPAAAVGGIIGGGMSVLKNSQNTKMPVSQKLKKALIAAGLGAATGYAMSKLKEVYQSIPRAATPDEAARYAQGPPDVRDYIQGPPDAHDQLLNKASDLSRSFEQLNAKLPPEWRNTIKVGNGQGNEILVQVKLPKDSMRVNNMNQYATRAFAKVLGTNDISGIQPVETQQIGNNIIRTYKWTPGAADAAQQATDYMNP